MVNITLAFRFNTEGILAIMPRTPVVMLPSLQRRLTHVGENIQLARLRRGLTATQLAERAGITRTTLRSIERGDGAVSFGAYANVLFCLGLEKELSGIARDDALGRKLQDADLAVKRRAPRRSRAVDPMRTSAE